MKTSEWEQAKKWLVRPSRKVDEGKAILNYIDSVKEKYGDAEPKYKSKLERVMELPQYKYENWAQDQKWSDVTKQKNPNYKPPPKKFFENLLPLPPIKKVKFEPLKYEYLPMEFDVEPLQAKKEIKRPKAEGIVSVLNLDKLGQVLSGQLT